MPDPRRTGLVTTMLVVSMACSMGVLVMLWRSSAPRWTGALSTLSLILVIASTAMLRRGSRR